MNKILLIDGNSIFYKTFFATFYSKGGYDRYGKDLDNFYDKENNGLRTFISIILKAYKIYDNILVAFDHKDLHTYRHEDSEYKATRDFKKIPKDLYRQMNLSKEFLNIYGLNYYEDIRYEADDIIGVFAKNLKKENDIDILTTDKDLLQLVDTNITVLLSKKGFSLYKINNVKNFKTENMGLSPKQIIDFKSLAGDPSDNIKGIKGIGRITAVKLILKYYSLEELLANYEADETESMRQKIFEGRANALISKRMVTIEIENKFDLDIYGIMEKTNYNEEKLYSFLEKNALFSILNRLKIE